VNNEYRVFTTDDFAHHPKRAETVRILNENGVQLCAPETLPKFEWPFRVIPDGERGCVILPPAKDKFWTYPAWYVKRPYTGATLVLVVFKYNSRQRGEAFGDGVIRQAFAPGHGVALVQPEREFTVALPTHHGHNTVRYIGVAQRDGNIRWELAPPTNRTRKIPADLPVYEPSDRLPVTVLTQRGYTVHVWNSGTLVRVDSAARAQFDAEIFVPREHYGRVAAMVACPLTMTGDTVAFVLESKLPIIHEFTDQHGGRFLVVSPRNNRLVVGTRDGKKIEFFVREDGQFERTGVVR